MAVGKALAEMTDDFVIKTFLLQNKAEVLDMCITEYNEAETYTLYGAQKEAKGRAEGRAEGRINTLSELVRNDLLSVENAAKTAGMSVSEFSQKAGI